MATDVEIPPPGDAASINRISVAQPLFAAFLLRLAYFPAFREQSSQKMPLTHGEHMQQGTSFALAVNSHWPVELVSHYAG